LGKVDVRLPGKGIARRGEADRDKERPRARRARARQGEREKRERERERERQEARNLSGVLILDGLPELLALPVQLRQLSPRALHLQS